MDHNMPARMKFAKKDIVVPITYSSVYKDGQLVPSTLSHIVADVATLIAEDHHMLVVAGEQSYRDHPENTGHLLTPRLARFGHDVHAFNHGRNRLLNTAYQTRLLAGRLSLAKSVTLVGWDYHLDRVVGNLRARRFSPDLRMISADSVLDDLWKSAELWGGDHELMEADFKQKYGLEVGWPEVRDNALVALKKREVLTRRAQLGDGAGRILMLLTTLMDSGRHDDVAPDGSAVMELTDPPRWKRLATAVSGLF